MSNLQQEAADLGLTVDGRWSDETLKQKIDEAKEARDSQSRDISNTDDKPAETTAKPVDTSDAKDVAGTGVMRVETSQEIRQREAGVAADPVPTDPKEAHNMAAENAKASQEAPEFNTADIEAAKEQTFPIRLLFDWWDGQGNRHERNSIVNVAVNDAVKLIQERKAERADPLPGQE